MQESEENLIAAACCALLGVTGLLVNGTTAILMLRIKELRTSFGFLTVFHTISNAFLISTYIFWVAPYILWDFSNAFGLNRSIGQVTIIAQFGAYISMLLLSMNRFVCVFIPTGYAVVFSNRSTFWYIIVSTLICLAYGCVYFDASCYFIFDRDSLEFTFSDSDCGQFVSDYVDFWFSIVLFAIACTLDIITLAKLQWLIRKDNRIFLHSSTSHFRRDLRFFAQTICSTALFTMTVICFHTISLSASGRLARFCATTLIWGVNHCGAGFIVIAFNRDIRQHILRILRFTDPRSNKVSSIRVAMHSRL